MTTDSNFDFNLVDFEKEYQEGKYDHLISQIKNPKALRGTTRKAKPANVVKVVPHIPQVEVAKPICLTEHYITYTCKECERKSRIRTQTLIKYSLRKSYVFRPITAANITDFKHIRSLNIDTEWQEELLTIDMCANCVEDYFPVENEKVEFTPLAFSDTILPTAKPKPTYDEEAEDEETESDSGNECHDTSKNPGSSGQNTNA
jgi:hypothetical protein